MEVTFIDQYFALFRKRYKLAIVTAEDE